MANVDEFIDGVSQIITEGKEGTLYFTVLDLKYSVRFEVRFEVDLKYSQLKLAADAAKHCNFNIVVGKVTGPYRFLLGFYG